MKTRFAVLVAAMGLAGATYAENPPQKTPAGGAPVNNRVNGEQYGNNAQKAPLYGPQSDTLPSEGLIATQRSGALPSEIRAQTDAVGPLAPSGAASYIPAESTLQRAAGVRPPALFGPAWGPRASAPPSGTVAPLPVNVSTQSPGFPVSTVVPSGLYVAPQRVEPQTVQAGYRIERLATPGEVSTGEGTVIRHLTRTPTTNPSTQPSAAELFGK